MNMDQDTLSGGVGSLANSMRGGRFTGEPYLSRNYIPGNIKKFCKSQQISLSISTGIIGVLFICFGEFMRRKRDKQGMGMSIPFVLNYSIGMVCLVLSVVSYMYRDNMAFCALMI